MIRPRTMKLLESEPKIQRKLLRFWRMKNKLDFSSLERSEGVRGISNTECGMAMDIGFQKGKM